MKSTVVPVESIEDVWKAAKQRHPLLRRTAADTAALPIGVQRYLHRAIALDAIPASAVRLHMHGEIKLGGWHPFTADQVISWNVGMIWQASVQMYGMTIRGSDRLLDGQGGMIWKLFGILPLMRASGPDITRSAAGRMKIESLWLPSVLAQPEVNWTAADANHLRARFTVNDEDAPVEYVTNDSGELESVSMSRWGNPGGAIFRYVPFGAIVEDSGTFGGYTIPTRVRVGWFFGTDRFTADGEFFRATINSALYL